MIPLPKRKKHALSRLMIVALVEAAVKQNQGIPFGPADIKGASVAPLIKRGLIIYKEVNTGHYRKSVWQVTSEGIEILKEKGIDIEP